MLICNAPEGPVLLMLPSTDCRIDDTWFVVGLRGSGSKDVVVEGAFVPRHRAVSMNDVREGCPPGRAIHGAPNYRIPMRSILSITLSASVLGMAQGGLDVFSETIQGRVSGRTGGKFAESVGLPAEVDRGGRGAAGRTGIVEAQLRGDFRKGQGQPVVHAEGKGALPQRPVLHRQAERSSH